MSIGYNILSYVLVMSFSYLGGWLVTYSNNKQQEYVDRLREKGKEAKLVLKMADLTGLMMFGLCMRNLPFLEGVMQYYPNKFHSWMSSVATSIVLLRIGLALRLDKNIKMVLMLVFLPFLVEWATYTILFPLFNTQMTFLAALAVGALMPPVGAAALAQNQIYFISIKKGLDKFLPQLLITACALENILSILLFGIICEVYFAASDPASTKSLGVQCMIQIAYNIGGFVVGAVLVTTFKALSKVFKTTSYLYSAFLMLTCITIICVCKYLKVQNIAFTGILSFAFWSNKYVLSGLPGDKLSKVNNEVRVSNDNLKTFLFGGVGASLVIKGLNQDYVQKAVILMTIGSAVRFLFGYLMYFNNSAGFTRKERVYLNASWYPKGTIQAAFSAQIYNYALENNIPLLKDVGQFVITLTSLLLIITIPIGSILSLNMGEKWLHSPPQHKQVYQPMQTTNQEIQMTINNDNQNTENKPQEQQEQLTSQVTTLNNIRNNQVIPQIDVDVQQQQSH